MASNNYEPRRFWKPHSSQRARCSSCGARATIHSPELSFCAACLDWARRSKLDDDDDKRRNQC
jgi:hypothetical protein